METILKKVDANNIDMTIIDEASDILKKEGLVAFPTETVYGLGANALSLEGAQKIYTAKGRPSDNPLIIHIGKFEDVKVLASQIPDSAVQLAKHFWPGPLTMILKKNDIVPTTTTGGLGTVAIRMPSNKVALELINHSGIYIAAPSANTSGRPSPTKAQHVYEDLNGKIDMIIDGGDGEIGLESTIIDLSEDVPTILRPGAITKAMLEAVIGPVELDKALENKDDTIRPKAPGMKYRHYAPKGNLCIVEGNKEEVIAYINEQTQLNKANGYKVAVMATSENAHLYKADYVYDLGSRAYEAQVAKHLYDALRRFDGLDMDFIYSESFDNHNVGQAIMNRLIKAAGHNIIRL